MMIFRYLSYVISRYKAWKKRRDFQSEILDASPPQEEEQDHTSALDSQRYTLSRAIPNVGEEDDKEPKSFEKDYVMVG